MTRAKELGELLKGRRQELKISIKEVENATSIRSSYLNALEEGKTEKLISAVYAEGFLKQYAIFLGIDGEKMVQENRSLFQRVEGQEFDYGIGTLEVRDNPGSNVKWFPSSLWIAGGLGVIFIGWYLAYLFGYLT
ncbi:helix-turn-helix domain-containing protein [Chlamydiales bacterium]|nr:helix-turn-helix domain-containing protein [Chlamydiales bacterium]